MVFHAEIPASKKSPSFKNSHNMKTILLAFFATLFFIGPLGASDKPNVIVIMADDMGYADAGFTGQYVDLLP